jgi:Cu(I)/Ag(I) efflux system membrane fusion protein
VSFINPEYRSGSQVLVMRAVLPNPKGRYQPGQQARVFLQQGLQRGLTLPVDAVVRAGEGAVVFVQVGEGTFQPRRVQTGTETDQRVAITKGLTGDETVAMSGAYLLYSELVLKKGVNPFTMQVDEEGVKSTPNAEANPTPIAQSNTGKTDEVSGISKAYAVPASFKAQLTDVYKASLNLTEAFISGDLNRTRSAASGVEKALASVDMRQLSGQAHTDWMAHLTSMSTALKLIRSSNDLEKQRASYAQFEEGLYRSVKAFGVTNKPVYRQYCPMALNNKGSYWLSDKEPIRNPYFGDQMLTCGETKEVIK